MRTSCIRAAAPIFQVRAIRPATAYYVQALGFVLVFEWTEPRQEQPDYAVLTYGQGEIHLTLRDSPQPCLAYFFVQEIDALALEMRKQGAILTREVANWPWNMREFVVTDPDGNRLIFGEHLSQPEA